MTRKDFELIAASLLHTKPDPYCLAEYDQYEVTCRHMADSLSQTNDRFDKPRFLKACGVED